MLLALEEAVKRRKIPLVDFFQEAHVYTFGKRDESYQGYIQFKLHWDIPGYVLIYAKHILEKRS